MNMPLCDVVIVGGGPAGMNAALVLARACRKVLLIDDGRPRNQVAQLLHGFLTRDGVRPSDLRAAARSELARYGVHTRYDRLVSAEPVPAPNAAVPRTVFQVRTAAGEVFTGRKLLFATGTRDVLPEIPGFGECYGTSIHHCPYCDAWEYRDQPLVAYGDEATAASGLAIALRNWSRRVTLLTDGNLLNPSANGRIERHGIVYHPDKVIRILHAQNHLTSVELASGELVPAVALFFDSQQKPACQIPEELGVEFPSSFAAESDNRQRTRVPGIFLAGDADGDVQFAIVAAAEGATAAVAINRELIEEDFS